MKINYRELYLNHFNCTLENDYSSGYDFEMSREYTADDYDVYLCIHPGESIYVSEHIYYYINNLEDLLLEKIDECDKIYCDDGIEEELYIEWMNLCESKGLIEWDDDNQEWVIAGEKDE